MRITAALISLILLTPLVIAQERSSADPVLRELGLGSGFSNCAYNSLTIDRIAAEAREFRDGPVIAIARLGRGEITRELNRRRLYTVRTYLQVRGLPTERLVTAEGERVSGYGRVDFYIRGKIFAALVADRCQDLPIGNCIEDFYVEPYYLPRRGRRRWCR